MNILSTDPYIATLNNFLCDIECNHFIEISKNRLKRSTVGAYPGIVSAHRTGSNTWIDINNDDVTKKVAIRIANIIGLPIENVDKYQIIHYDIKQEYKKHYDSWLHDGSDNTLRSMKYGGARLKTALCYLNNVTKGGGTKMTKLNITIPAEKGKLLIFNNTISSENNNLHELSEHAGLPVEEGEKYAFNLWFRECGSKILYKDFNPSYYINKN